MIVHAIEKLIAFIVLLVITLCSYIIFDESENLSCGQIEPIYGGKERSRPQLSKLQTDTYNKYRVYALKKNPPSFKEFCFPTSYKLQPPQKFLAEYMSPGTSNDAILAFHRIGAGKTCAAISIAERHIRDGMRPLVLMPASLLPGFRNELRTECPEHQYITDSERKELAMLPQHSERRREIIAHSNEKIAHRYQLYSYNKFLKTPHNALKPTSVIIIDEVQNINNPRGNFYHSVMHYIEKHPHVKIVLLSATPVFDSAAELISLLRLMRVECPPELLNEPITGFARAELLRRLDGKISYYEGAPAHVFPRINLHFDVCKMSNFQTKWYTAEVEREISRKGNLIENAISDNFYIKSRARSNIVFPRGLAGTDGLPKLTKSKILQLSKYSCKFAKLIKRLQKGQLSFVYTNFTSFGGIKTIRHCLRAFGFTEFNKHGPGRKRFAVWTGDETPTMKDRIRSTYNDSRNDDASQLQIIIGSPSMKEGVSLFRTRQVHVLEPYWNQSRHAQIFGRASRFCSHKSLPARDRNVDIYLYLAATSWSKCTSKNLIKYDNIAPDESVDIYILNIANRKNETITTINEILMDAAVDRKLNQRP
jgi:hypothetical protein